MSDCKAALNVKGEHISCDLEAPHPGLAHNNKEREALWCSDGEAKAAARKAKETKQALDDIDRSVGVA